MNNLPDDGAYLSALDRRLSTLVKGTRARLLDVFRDAEGAFPLLVAQRLEHLNLMNKLETDPMLTAPEGAPALAGPELHPLDFDWYFTRECANYLADLLATDDGDILCLGAPTVAAALVNRGRKVTLVDRNPLVLARFPILKDSRFQNSDLFKPLPSDKSYSTVFFDSPWYPEFLALWLWQSSRVVSLGGRVIFALFPRLARPGALAERDAILARATSIGFVQHLKGVLSYDTPFFERVVLEHSGLRVSASWRKADLVLLGVGRKDESPMPTFPDSEDRWDTFLYGRQVVRLRNPVRDASDEIIEPLDEFPDFVFPSVSRRHPCRNQIDLWTSRNRIARVGQRPLVSRILEFLSEGGTVENLKTSPFLSSLSEVRKTRVVSNLSKLLDLS